MDSEKEQFEPTTAGDRGRSAVEALAIPTPSERTCADASPDVDPEAIERLIQVWGEVGQAILKRRRQGA